MNAALRPLALTLAFGPALACAAAEPEPTPSDVPTLEEVQKVTGTTEYADTEDVYVGEAMSIDATRRREIAYRTIAVALDRPRSDKEEAADDLVCRRVPRPNSHIVTTLCATNRTWNYVRRESTKKVLGSFRGVNGPAYPLYKGPVYEIYSSAISKLGKQFEGEDHAGRLAELVAEDAALKLNDEWNTPAETVSRFARALDAVSQAGKGGDPAAQERAMAAAIAAHGFTVEQYNDLATRLESSGLFQRRVAAATQAFKR